jgi:hypothetical protein
VSHVVTLSYMCPLASAKNAFKVSLFWENQSLEEYFTRDSRMSWRVKSARQDSPWKSVISARLHVICRDTQFSVLVF